MPAVILYRNVSDASTSFILFTYFRPLTIRFRLHEDIARITPAIHQMEAPSFRDSRSLQGCNVYSIAKSYLKIHPSLIGTNTPVNSMNSTVMVPKLVAIDSHRTSEYSFQLLNGSLFNRVD